MAALIINWNGSADTLELLDSLRRQTNEAIAVEAFVVDNNSSADDLSLLENGIASMSGIAVHLLKNNFNEGVPAAYNRAIEAAGCGFDYYLRLDNDVVLLEGCLAKLIDGLERWHDRNIHLVGCNVRYFDRPDENNGGAVRFDLVRGRTHITYPELESTCDGVLGCVMLIDNEVVKEFFPNVFLGWLFYTTDESELSLRCAKRGWLTLYLPHPLALHKGGHSTIRAGTMPVITSVRNWTYLAVRYAHSDLSRVFVLCRVLLILLPSQVVQFRWSTAGAVLRGLATACFRTTPMGKRGG